jgi:hypothetical protein
MCSSYASDQLASQQIKEGPAKEAWIKEQVKFEIERLKGILRDPRLTAEERSIAQSQIANYRQMTQIAVRPSADWLDQIYLLAS